MSFKILAIAVATGATIAPVAYAGGKPQLPGAKHAPPRFIDESSALLEIGNQSDGWSFNIKARVEGATGKSDFVRVDWKQGGKVLASVKCSGVPNDAKAINASCSQTSPPIKAKGVVTGELIYVDDAEDKEYLLRTFTADVKSDWDKNYWAAAPDDLLASAWAVESETQTSAQSPHPRLRFWIASSHSGFDAVLRCTVDGKPLADLAASAQSIHDIKITGKKTWTWTLLEVEMSKAMDGAKDAKRTDLVWLADNPGKWSCFYRRDGRNLRELLFTVNAKGGIDSHPMQGASAAPLAPGISLIDIRIPKDAGFDQRIKPDQLKKSRGFGLAWPKDGSVAAIHAALPAAVENADPRPPAKVAGKQVPGLEHSPPRYTDESSNHIFVIRRNDGYTFNLSTRMAGFGQKSDGMRIDLKQGGKVVAKIPCGMSDLGNGRARVSCENDEPIKPVGAVEAQLVYSDDQDGKEYLVRNYKLTVVKLVTFGDPVWQIVADDVLGSAWVRHVGPLELHDAVYGHPHFVFWTAHRTESTMSLRCTVNGTKIEDIPLSGTGLTAEITATKRTQGKPDVNWIWARQELIANIHHGDPQGYQYINADERKKGRWLIDSPGTWSCDVRFDANVIRKLQFTVDNKGMIQNDPMESGKGALPAYADTVTIDMRIPKDSKFDNRIRPDAIKKSRPYGLPWPDSPNARAIQASFPPASGLPDLK